CFNADQRLRHKPSVRKSQCISDAETPVKLIQSRRAKASISGSAKPELPQAHCYTAIRADERIAPARELMADAAIEARWPHLHVCLPENAVLQKCAAAPGQRHRRIGEIVADAVRVVRVHAHKCVPSGRMMLPVSGPANILHRDSLARYQSLGVAVGRNR